MGTVISWTIYLHREWFVTRKIWSYLETSSRRPTAHSLVTRSLRVRSSSLN